MNKAIKELYCSYDQLKINISDTFQVKSNFNRVPTKNIEGYIRDIKY